MNKIEIYIPTHNTKKPASKDYRPPRTTMLKSTLKSINEKIIGSANINKTVVFNYHSNKDDKYLNNVKHFCETNNLGLIIDESKGYKGLRINVGKSVQSEYIFWIEHDWNFLVNIDLYKVIDVFDKYGWINYIRFNKRKNEVHYVDKLIYEDKRINELKLCGICNYSNNPHIERVSTLRDIWIPICENSHLREGMNGGAAGFEHPLREKAMNDFKKSKNKIEYINSWGLYLYGSKNYKPTVKHIGKS